MCQRAIPAQARNLPATTKLWRFFFYAGTNNYKNRGGKVARWQADLFRRRVPLFYRTSWFATLPPCQASETQELNSAMCQRAIPAQARNLPATTISSRIEKISSQFGRSRKMRYPSFKQVG